MFGLAKESENLELLTLDQVYSLTFLDELFREFQPLAVDAFKSTRATEFADQTMYFGIINYKQAPTVTVNVNSESTSPKQKNRPPSPRPSVGLAPPARPPTTRTPSSPFFDDQNAMNEERQQVASVGNASSQSATSTALPPGDPNISLWTPSPKVETADSDSDSSSDCGDPQGGASEKAPLWPKMPRMSFETAKALNTKAIEELERRNKQKYMFDEYGFPLVSEVKPLRVMNPDVGPSTQKGTFSSRRSSSPNSIYRRIDDWGPSDPTPTPPVNVSPLHRSGRGPQRGNYDSSPRTQKSNPIWNDYIPYDKYPEIKDADADSGPMRNYIGFVYLTIPYVEGEANMGIIINQNYRRKGLARQAVDFVLKCAFEELKLHRVQTLVADSPCKDAAITFLIQMGFSHEGTRRRSVFAPTGAWIDVTYFSMLDTDWTMRGCIRPAPRSLWDEMFARHQREREELLRWDEHRLKRTTSLETVRGPLVPVVHEIMYDSSVVSETDGADAESFVSFPETVSGTARSLNRFEAEMDEDPSSLPSSSQGSPSLRSVSSVSRHWEVLSSASEPLESDLEVSDFEMVDGD